MQRPLMVLATFLLGFFAARMAQCQELAAQRMNNSGMFLATDDTGRINYNFKGKKVIWNTFLTVRWDICQYKKDQLSTLSGRKDADGISIAGKLLNAAFSEKIASIPGGFSIRYDIMLDSDNEFSLQKFWQLHPYVPQKLMESLAGCRYTLVSDEGATSGVIGENLIANTHSLRQFVFHNIEGKDVVLEFPEKAIFLDRRREAKPEGLMFVIPARNEKGVKPARRGDGGVMRYNVRYLDKAQTKAPSTTNLLTNPSFEIETNPGYADSWGNLFYNYPTRGLLSIIEDWDFYMKPVTEEAFHGKKSMRLIGPKVGITMSMSHTYVRSGINRPYVFSIYMKGQQHFCPEITIRIRALKNTEEVQKTFVLTPEWKRYTINFKTNQKDGGNTAIFQLWIYAENGVAWLDAAQVETGMEATVFSGRTTEDTFEPAPVVATPEHDDTRQVFDARLEERNLKRASFNLPEVAGAPPTLDGKLDDAFWKKALTFDKFLDFRSGAAKAKNTTEARLGLQDGKLYLGFVCKGPNSPPLRTIRDDMAWLDDSVEIFLQTNKEGNGYYHIVLNNGGCVYDIFRKTMQSPFDGDIKAKTHRSEEYWTAEIEIPLSELNRDLLTRKIRFNLCRNDHTGNTGHSSVFFADGSFHNYRNYGEGVLPENSYGLLAKAFRENAKNKDVEKDKPLTAQFKFSYYMDDAEAVLLFSRKLKNTKKLELSFNGADSVFGKQCFVSPDGNRCRVDLTGIPDGEFEVEVALDGEVLPGRIHFARKPAHDNAVRVDNEGHCLRLKNGNAFIPYTALLPHLAYHNLIVLNKLVLPKCKADGFNTVITIVHVTEPSGDHARKWTIREPEKVKEFLDSCEKNGLKVILGHSSLYGGTKTPIPEMSREILTAKLRDHPALLAWWVEDEPYSKEALRLSRESIAKVLQLDPWHPVMVNLTLDGAASDFMRDDDGGYPMEIFSISNYPIGELNSGDERFLANDVFFENVCGNVFSSNSSTVVMNFGQSYGYGVDCWDREPTPQELTYLVYMPLIFGNRGQFWLNTKPKCRAVWDRLRKIGHEVQKLTPALAAEKVGGDTVITSVSGNAYGTLLKLEDRFCFITVSKSTKESNEEFDLHGLLPENFQNSNIVVEFEDRLAVLKNGTLSDRFTSYERHVYFIGSGENE